MIRLLLIGTLIYFLVGCTDDNVIAEETEGDRYLIEILDAMEKYSVFKDTKDWPQFRDSVMNYVPHPKSIAHTTRSIEFAIKLLGDHHSYYVSGTTVIWDKDVCTWPVVFHDIQPMEDIGVVKVSGFQPGGYTDSEEYLDEKIAYATGIQNSIREQDHAGIKGWIVDLRNNGGGFMYPMLAGIGPILGEDTAGYFFDVGDQRYFPYWYEQGKAINSGYVHLEISDPYTLLDSDRKVAVLIDKANSAGEGIAVAFVGRPNTKLFGTQGTCGRTSGIIGQPLSDGAMMSIAHSWMVDRTKYVWQMRIPPDVSSQTDEEAIEQAIRWIRD